MQEEITSKHAACPKCLSHNVFGMSRVVGYYSIIENWNASKQTEFAHRQKGKYQLNDASKIEVIQKQIESPIKVTVNGCC